MAPRCAHESGLCVCPNASIYKHHAVVYCVQTKTTCVLNRFLLVVSQEVPPRSRSRNMLQKLAQ